jgi:signal transduction histidine kinase
MGLAISRAIVEAHGGRLLVENDPAGGAMFRLHLRNDQRKTA